MHAPLLPFDTSAVPRRRKAGHVRETSVIAKQAAEAHLEGRAAETLRELESWLWMESFPPTSGELARRFHRVRTVQAQAYKRDAPEWTADLLHIRRGISDLQTRGVVEAVPQGKRTCAVTGQLCQTWRVRQR